MYTKDLNHRMTLRLDDETFDFVTKVSEQMNMSPSAFIRVTLSSLRSTMKVQLAEYGKEMGDSHADEQTNINNLLQ